MPWPARSPGSSAWCSLAPWVTVGIGRLELALATSLLGRSATQEHVAQVTQLETSRSAAVDSAEAERRRIERDLHDGAQQRLVALAANLGAAREKLDRDEIEEGRVMVAVAHEEAKSALREIRDLVRGIHPVILEDRGLDAALSAVVARSPIPVSLDVTVAERPPAAVESAAYFVVNEALTNVARHAMATKAFVSIARAGDRLVVEVRDDGIGGAELLTEDATGAAARKVGRACVASAIGWPAWAARCTSSAPTAVRRRSRWSCRADRDRRGLRAAAGRPDPDPRRRRRGRAWRRSVRPTS